MNRSMNEMAMVVLTVGALGTTAHAAVDVFVDDEPGWWDSAGPVETIDFTGFPDLTVITDQYADRGVYFPGIDVIGGPSRFSYPEDGWGLQGTVLDGSIFVEFDVPVRAFATHHPGLSWFRFWSGDDLTFETESFIGGSGPGWFAGFTFETPIDRVEIYTPFELDEVAIDNLYFTPIPGPAGIAVITMAVAFGRSRRRG